MSISGNSYENDQKMLREFKKMGNLAERVSRTMDEIQSIIHDVAKIENKSETIFKIANRYDSYDGSDYAVIIDEEGRETDYDLSDLKDLYGCSNISIICKSKE